MNKIKLTILMPSYNKEEYIKQAIDSVLSQKTDFNFRLVITDDGSKDKTLNIINNYIKKHPDKIVLLPSETNQGLLRNIIKAYEYLIKNKSEYFCCLDADDFLTDNHFYQKAVDFLDKNHSYNIYAANTILLYNDGTKFVQNQHVKSDFVDSEFEDMLAGKAVLGNTISSVFRNCVINQKLIEKLKKHIGNHYQEHSVREDDFRNRIHLEHSKAHYVHKTVGMYRITTTGLFRGSNTLKSVLLKIQSYIDSYYFFDKKYPKFIDLALHNIKRIETEALNSDMNNLLKYDVRDIVQLCKILDELSKHNIEYIENVIKTFNVKIIKKDSLFERICKNIFSIDRCDTEHKIICIFGLKIKIKSR